MSEEPHPGLSTTTPSLRGFWWVVPPGRANLRLIRKTIHQGWDIPEAARQALVDHLEAVVVSGHPRNVLAAAWCLVEAERANLRDEEWGWESYARFDAPDVQR